MLRFLAPQALTALFVALVFLAQGGAVAAPAPPSTASPSAIAPSDKLTRYDWSDIRRVAPDAPPVRLQLEHHEYGLLNVRATVRPSGMSLDINGERHQLTWAEVRELSEEREIPVSIATPLVLPLLRLITAVTASIIAQSAVCFAEAQAMCGAGCVDSWQYSPGWGCSFDCVESDVCDPDDPGDPGDPNDPGLDPDPDPPTPDPGDDEIECPPGSFPTWQTVRVCDDAVSVSEGSWDGDAGEYVVEASIDQDCWYEQTWACVDVPAPGGG